MGVPASVSATLSAEFRKFYVSKYSDSLWQKKSLAKEREHYKAAFVTIISTTL